MNITIDNDFMNNGVTDSRDPNFRWNGTNVRNRKPPLTNQQLAALRDAAAAKGRALSDDERAEVLGIQ